MDAQQKNRRLALRLGLVVAVMVGLAYASVPLYSLFCRTTGFGGTTQRVASVPVTLPGNRTVTVTLNADVAPDLPWEFAPEVRHVSVRIGEPVTIRYRARNISSRAIVGTSVYNVQPDKTGIYFNKTECFCFVEQMLLPGQEAYFPVTFFIDAAMAQDRKQDDVQDIALSYTFFMAKNQAKAKLALNSAAPTLKSN